MSDRPEEEKPQQPHVDVRYMVTRRIAYTYIALFVTMTCSLLLVLIPPGLVCLVALIAFAAPIRAMIVSFERIPILPDNAAAIGRFERVSLWAGRILAPGSLLVACWVILNLIAGARLASASGRSSANLHDLGRILGVYHHEYGTYPPDLTALILFDEDSSYRLRSTLDRTGRQDWPTAPYSSFVYQPGSGPWRDDPALILAHERLPWTYGDPSWCRPRGYLTLFADGTVRWLTIDEMAEAQRIDVERRREINWPVTPLTGALDPPPPQD